MVGVCAVALLCSCVQDDFLLSSEGKEREISFRPILAGDATTRAIGEGLLIDQLVVAVYEGDAAKVEKFITTESWDDAQREGVSLRLIEGHTYHILFWAECSSNTAYNFTADGCIAVDYTDYTTGGFALMEQMDAFYTVATVTVGTDPVVNKRVELSRPLAQLNFADSSIQPQSTTHKTVVTLHSIPTAFNPFTGAVTVADNAHVEFTFTDYPAETLLSDGEVCYYLSNNYLFAPATIKATLDLQQAGGASIKTITFDGSEHPLIALEQNMKTNVTGTIVQQPQSWSVWDGTSRTKPDKDAQGRYVIDAASDVAWMCSPIEPLEVGSEFIQTVDIDMDNKEIASIQLPAGSTYDGGEKKIINFENSLFGDATELIVKNLSVENIDATALSHVGVLVNTLKGNSSFSNISITTATAYTNNGAAGGMVGYVERKVQKDRNEMLQVTFSNCKLNGVEADANLSEGKFVGLLCGYDNQETLTFDALCEVDGTTRVKDYVSVYKKANQSAWVESTISDKYDGWVGHETYRRGKIYFDGVRLVPRWDGVTVIAAADLLLHNNTEKEYEVYSPFDLAGVRKDNASPTALYLMENVDMHGQGEDGKFFMHSKFPSVTDPAYSTNDDDNHFSSFNYVDFLEGYGNSIYNLSIYSTFNGATTYYGAFILYCRGTTTHQNINLYNSCTIVPHVVKDNEDKSYGAAFVCNNDCSTYTMTNVHLYNCKVFALQKTGALTGRLGVNLSGSIDNCSVNDCYIENYECKEHAESFAVTTFYSYGEIGGMFGFVEDQAKITNCHVRRTTINAFGQADKRVLLFINIPGRHVSTFIGDIRTSENTGDYASMLDKIEMENCTVDDATKCTNRYDKHSSTYNTIGKVYYVSLAGDKKGTVTFDGKGISL